MTRFFFGLRFRLLLLVLLALLPALGVIIYTASEQRRLAAAQAQENALRLARIAAGSQDELIEGTHQLLIALAQFPAVRHRDPVVCSAFLANFLKQFSHYETFGATDREGNVFCSAVPTGKPINIGDDSFISKVLETRDFAAAEYRIDPVSGKAVLGFGYPLLDEMGQAQGVVFTVLDLDLLNELAAQVLMPPGSTLTMRDRNGTIVARYPDPEKGVGQSLPEAPIVKIISSQQSEGTAEAIGADNVPRLYAFTPLRSVPQNDIYISVGIPTDVAFAEVYRVLARNLVALGLAAALALAAAWVGGDWFLLRRVNALLNVTSRLADGDLSARTGLRYGVGELSQLARAFDRMVATLEQREAERKQAEEQVRRWGTQVEGLLNTIAEAISQPLEVSKIADIALRRTLSVTDLAAGCVFLKQGEDFILIAHSGLLEAVARRLQGCNLGEEVMSEIARLVHSDAVQNISEGSLPSALSEGERFGTWVSVPIKSKGHVFGVMCLASNNRQLLEANEQSVLAAVGQQVGVAIENAELYAQVQSIAALKERERLGRELHDGLAQVLGYLCIRNKVAADLVAAGEVERAEEQLHEMQRAMQEAYQDLREAILGLRMTVSPNRGLVSALKEYVHKFSQQTGIRVNLTSNGNDQIGCSPEAEVQLLRIIQEALANARKHSRAKRAWIRFEPRAGSVIVTIEDNGKGFDVTSVSQDGQPRFGLQTMRERAESAGGSFRVSSQPGQGTKVVVTLPCREGGE